MSEYRPVFWLMFQLAALMSYYVPTQPFQPAAIPALAAELPAANVDKVYFMDVLAKPYQRLFSFHLN